MLKCSVCPKRFFQASVRDAHVKVFHGQVTQNFSVPDFQTSGVKVEVDCKPDIGEMKQEPCDTAVDSAFEFISPAVKKEPEEISTAEHMVSVKEEDTEVSFADQESQGGSSEDLYTADEIKKDTLHLADSSGEVPGTSKDEVRATSSQPSEDAKKFIVTCPLCSTRMVLGSLYGHLKSQCVSKQTIEWPWICECKEKFWGTPNLYSHWARTHADPLNVWPWKCQYCNLPCKNRANLSNHLREKHLKKTSKTVVCSVCQAELKESSLYSHMTRHVDIPDRLFRCAEEGCGQTFVTTGSYRAHARTTHGSLVCSICDKRFQSINGLKNHFRKNHATEIDIPKPEK